jgi:hypothetical protein
MGSLHIFPPDDAYTTSTTSGEMNFESSYPRSVNASAFFNSVAQSANSTCSDSVHPENETAAKMLFFSHRKEHQLNGQTDLDSQNTSHHISVTAQSLEEILMRQLANLEKRLRISLASDRARSVWSFFSF